MSSLDFGKGRAGIGLGLGDQRALQLQLALGAFDSGRSCGDLSTGLFDAGAIVTVLDPEEGLTKRLVTLRGIGSFGPRLAHAKAVHDLLKRADWSDAARIFMLGDASTRAYERLTKPDGRTAILMSLPPRPRGAVLRNGKTYAEIAQLSHHIDAFIAMDEGLRERGFSAPEIHTVDRVELAERLDRICDEEHRRIDVLVQVDLGHEATKAGADEAEIPALVETLDRARHLSLKGLMTLPPLFDDAEQVRPFFRRLREIRDQLNQSRPLERRLAELSMGMSHDFLVAIEEGATMVRVGTAIFGARTKL